MTHPPPLASAKGKKPTGNSALPTPSRPPAKGRSRDPDSPKGEVGTLPDTGLYVYCILPPVASCEFRELETRCLETRNLKLETVCCGPLSALVTQVPLADFSPESLKAHQNDLPWLEERVKRHHEVIRAAMSRTTVLPMRFGTIFISHQALLEFLKENEPLFTRLLENFQGRQEWGAKLFHHSPPQFPVAGCELREPETRNSKPETAPSGRDYLLRKRRQRLARQKGETEAIAKAAELHHSLSHYAVSSRVHNSTVAPQEASEPTLVFSASYLVDAASLPFFVKAAEEFAASASPHFQATISGPWPPYSFVSVQDISTPLQQQPADPDEFQVSSCELQLPHQPPNPNFQVERNNSKPETRNPKLRWGSGTDWEVKP